jgi:hypothetical protein
MLGFDGIKESFHHPPMTGVRCIINALSLPFLLHYKLMKIIKEKRYLQQPITIIYFFPKAIKIKTKWK